MRFHHTARRFYLAPVLGLVLVAAISACSSGGSSSSSSTPAATPASSSASSGATGTGATGTASAVAAITTNWNEFFSSTTPNSKRVELLQNGSEFSTAISAFAKSPLAAAVSSKVDSVTVTSPTTANVKYDLTAGGVAVASGQTGTAVLQDGTWKVGDDVFCGLLKEGASIIGIAVPAACSSAS
jgi:ABC-type phosphate transport system substrate-binding protein